MTPLDTALRFVGEVHEIPGANSDPAIVWFHACTIGGVAVDEVPWCSSFASRVAWLHRLPRSKSKAARSWLLVGTPTPLELATAGWDVVVLSRGPGPQPGPEVTSGAAGHVGFFVGLEGDQVAVCGGNQSNGVTVARFPVANVLGVRRLQS